MADSVRRQIINAVVTKLLGIDGIGKRVYRQLRDYEDVEGTPALCVWAAEDDKVVENTAHKGGLLQLLITGYEAGTKDDAGLSGKIELLAKSVEDAIEADPGLGVDGVDSRAGQSGARVVHISTNSLGLQESGETMDSLNVEVLIPYRHLVGVS